MNLIQVEKERSKLFQTLIILVMISQVIITYTSFNQEQGYIIAFLMTLSLIACLYVIAQERCLTKLQAQLQKGVLQKERHLKKLEQEVKDERAEHKIRLYLGHFSSFSFSRKSRIDIDP